MRGKIRSHDESTFVGALVLDVRLQPHLLVLVVLPLSSAPLAALGAYIGSNARRPEEAMSLNQLLTFILLGMGPVLVPPERLPGFVVTLGYFSPATYAASALRQVLLGPLTNRLWLDIGFMLLFTLLGLWIVSRKMDWRHA